MAKQLVAWTVLAKDLSLMPGTQIGSFTISCNSIFRESATLLWPPKGPYTHVHILTQRCTCIYII